MHTLQTITLQIHLRCLGNQTFDGLQIAFLQLLGTMAEFSPLIVPLSACALLFNYDILLSEKVRVALEALSLVGEMSVARNASDWLVTFLNNAGDLPLLQADDSGLWGGVSIAVSEERSGTSETISGTFELGLRSNPLERIVAPYDSSAAEVSSQKCIECPNCPRRPQSRDVRWLNRLS